jgi:hypothetical protein
MGNSSDTHKTLTLACHQNRPADAQRENERESVFDELEHNQCRALVSTFSFRVEAMCSQFNQTFELGHTEMIGRSITSIFGPEPNIQVWNRLMQAAELGIAKEDVIRTHSMEGRIMSTQFAVLPFSTQRGEVTHVLLTLTTLKKKCALSCACSRDFRDSEVIGALVSAINDPVWSADACRLAVTALHMMSLDSKGMETLQKENAFSALAQVVVARSTKHGRNNAKSLALELLKSVAMEKPSVLNDQDTIGPVLGVISNSENDGTRLQLSALEIIHSLTWDRSCVRLMLHSDTDVVSLLNLVQDRLRQNFHLRHVYVLGQALDQIRGIGTRSRTKQNPHLLPVCEDTFGVDMARPDKTSIVPERRNLSPVNLRSTPGRSQRSQSLSPSSSREKNQEERRTSKTKSKGKERTSAGKSLEPRNAGLSSHIADAAGTNATTDPDGPVQNRVNPLCNAAEKEHPKPLPCANDVGWIAEAAPTKQETNDQLAAFPSQRAAQLAEAVAAETRDREERALNRHGKGGGALSGSKDHHLRLDSTDEGPRRETGSTLPSHVPSPRSVCQSKHKV